MSAHSLNDLIDYLKVNPSHLNIIIASLFACALLLAAISTIAHFKDKSQLSDISGILAGVCLISFAFTAIFSDWQQNEHSGDYTITRKGAYLYVNSHSAYLESAKLEITKQDKNYVYAECKDKTYKIPQIRDN